jgi:hypothetical protein
MNYGVTKAEHDAYVAATGRPYTQRPIQLRRERTDDTSEAVSLLDLYVPPKEEDR